VACCCCCIQSTNNGILRAAPEALALASASASNSAVNNTCSDRKKWYSKQQQQQTRQQRRLFEEAKQSPKKLAQPTSQVSQFHHNYTPLFQLLFLKPKKKRKSVQAENPDDEQFIPSRTGICCPYITQCNL